MSIDVPSGGNWSVTGSGFRYRDRTAGGGSDGVSSVRLKKSAGGTDHPRGRVRLVARGPNVELPSVANANLDNLQAQLVNSDGSCWGGKVSLKLEDYPFFPNEVLEEDPEFLNELASHFASTRRLAGRIKSRTPGWTRLPRTTRAASARSDSRPLVQVPIRAWSTGPTATCPSCG